MISTRQKTDPRIVCAKRQWRRPRARLRGRLPCRPFRKSDRASVTGVTLGVVRWEPMLPNRTEALGCFPPAQTLAATADHSHSSLTRNRPGAGCSLHAAASSSSAAIRSGRRNERPSGMHSRLARQCAPGQREESGEHHGVSHGSVSPPPHHHSLANSPLGSGWRSMQRASSRQTMRGGSHSVDHNLVEHRA